MFLSDRVLSLVVIDLFEEKEADEDIEQGKGDQDSPVLQDVFGREGIFAVLALGSGQLPYLMVDFVDGKYPLNPGDQTVGIFVAHGVQGGQKHG